MSKVTTASDKRERIINAAVKVFSSKGFYDTKVEEIAQLADVGKGTVYEYFSSKAELFQEMFKSGMESYHKSITEQLSSGNPCNEKLKEVARLHLKFILESRELAKITMSEHAHFDQDFRKWLVKVREQKLIAIENVILKGVEQGEFRKDLDARAASMVFSGMMGSLFGPAVMGNQDSGSLEETLEKMLDVFLRGINFNSNP